MNRPNALTRNARRLFIQGFPLYGTTENEIRTFFATILFVGLHLPAVDKSLIISVYLNKEKNFTLVELCSIELTKACLLLKGINFRNQHQLRIERDRTFRKDSLPLNTGLGAPVKMDYVQIDQMYGKSSVSTSNFQKVRLPSDYNSFDTWSLTSQSTSSDPRLKIDTYETVMGPQKELMSMKPPSNPIGTSWIFNSKIPPSPPIGLNQFKYSSKDTDTPPIFPYPNHGVHQPNEMYYENVPYRSQTRSDSNDLSSVQSPSSISYRESYDSYTESNPSRSQTIFNYPSSNQIEFVSSHETARDDFFSSILNTLYLHEADGMDSNHCT